MFKAAIKKHTFNNKNSIFYLSAVSSSVLEGMELLPKSSSTFPSISTASSSALMETEKLEEFMSQ